MAKEKFSHPRQPRKKGVTKKPRGQSVAEEFKSASPYMNAAYVDGKGGVLEVTIGSSKREKMPDGKETKRVVFWDDTEIKPLVLNKTNGRFLIREIGEYPEDWVGRTLRIENEETPKGPGPRITEVLDSQFAVEYDLSEEEDEEEDEEIDV